MRELVLDVSKYDTGMVYGAWKEQRGLWGVIVKCGGNEGGRYKDSLFEQHYANAKAAGLNVGSYYYTTSTTVAAARADAEHCLSLVAGKSWDLPIYIDVEDAGQMQIGRQRLTDVVKAFCDRIDEAGYVGGVYTALSWWDYYVYADQLKGYADWIAVWTGTRPSSIADCGMWQQGGIRLSDGDIVFGDRGGYHDCDWCYVDYPSIIAGGGPGRDAEPSDARVRVSLADVAARIHYDMVTDERNGYSQAPYRWGGDHPDGSRTLTINGREYTYKLGSYDCSSSVITAWRLALQGTPCEGKLDRATYTGDMRSVFVASGLFEASLTPARRGDLYLAESKHTAMCQDGGSDGFANRDMLSEFNRNENHAATGGKVGDQDGFESVYRPYYDDGWNTVLHYNGLADYETEEATEGKTEDETEEDEMVAIIHPEGKSTLYYVDGTNVHPIQNADELEAIKDLYAATHGGSRMPSYKWDADKANRLFSLLKRKAQ